MTVFRPNNTLDRAIVRRPFVFDPPKADPCRSDLAAIRSDMTARKGRHGEVLK